MTTQILKFLLALLLTSHLLVAQADTTTPDTVIINMSNTVLELLKADTGGDHPDMNKIGKMVEEQVATKFDFERMSKMTLGRAWLTASTEQKKQFTTEFRALLVRTYSSALSKYRNQTIEYKPLNTTPNDNEVKVRTMIIESDENIPLDYSLQKKDGLWKVYDVSIDGLSLVASYRGQFSEEIKNNGLDSLIQKLSDKNKPLT